MVVFFDIGNVLLRYDGREVARTIAWELRRHPLAVMREVWRGELVDSIERGKLSPEQLYALFRDKLGFSGSYGRFRLLWCDHFTLERRNAALLKSLAERHRVFLLSNTNALHYEFIRERYAFARQVHGAVLSYELGLRKPERAIYEAALKAAGAKPEESVFIDDLEENVRGARAAGIAAIRHTAGVDLKSELAKLGVD